jgi:hypothetical protein
MDLKNFTKQAGQFLSAKIVNEHPNMVFIIQSEGELITNKFDEERVRVLVTLGTEEYTFDMSKTNARTVEKELGSETSAWISKGLVLETYKTKTEGGKLVDAINVKEVKK